MCKPSELGPVLKGCSHDRDVAFERRHLSQSMRASFEAVGGKEGLLGPTGQSFGGKSNRIPILHHTSKETRQIELFSIRTKP